MTCCPKPAPGNTLRCEKYGVDMCRACLRCRDPELYCKFRSACLIHFMEKERQRHRPKSAEEPTCHDQAEPSV